MSHNEKVVRATPEQVWAVLADGWLYPVWVVGATRMRSVDAAWPRTGARLNHSAGVWPATIDDHTEVLAYDLHRSLKMQARGWPLGEAEVLITLEPTEGGTRITIEEDATVGPGRFVPAPVRRPLIAWRNRETLRRLAFVVEGRT